LEEGKRGQANLTQPEADALKTNKRTRKEMVPEMVPGKKRQKNNFFC